MSETKGTAPPRRRQTALHQLHDAVYGSLRVVETYDFPDNETTRALGRVARGLLALLKQAPKD